LAIERDARPRMLGAELLFEKGVSMAREIVVLSAVEAEDFECDSPWACISIATTEDAFIRVRKKRRRGLLQIAFADADKPLPGWILFDTDHAHDILDFVTNHWKRIDTLMIHCEQGRSRSAAVAAAVAWLKFGDESQFFEEPFVPNHFIYRTLLEVAKGRGDYQGSY
jgi:predicted protein tyrosine phosphatase